MTTVVPGISQSTLFLRLKNYKTFVASPHNVLCSDLCTGFKNVKTWRVSNPRRVSLLLELISQVYVTATPSRLSLLNLAIHRVVRECIVLLLCWQVSTHARLFVIYMQYINDTTTLSNIPGTTVFLNSLFLCSIDKNISISNSCIREENQYF